MWGRASTGRENEVRFTALHPYEVSGAAGPVSGPSGGPCSDRSRSYPPPGGSRGKRVNEQFGCALKPLPLYAV